MSDLLVTEAGSVVEIRLNRPKKKNALSFAMYDAFTAALESANGNPKVRAALVSAEGDSFCAGNDIQDFLSSPALDMATAPPIKFIEALIAFEKPLLIAVSGNAVGIGTTMLLHADLVYADESARFSVPFVSLGLVPEAASSILLRERIGVAAASDMLLRGAVVDAKRAHEIGLINEVVVAPNDLLGVARERAKEVSAKPPAAMRLTKALSRHSAKELIAQVHHEGRIFGERVVSEEAREAFSAFLERRTPDFSKFS